MLQSKQILNNFYQLEQNLAQNPGHQTWIARDLSANPPIPVVVKLLAFSPQMQWEEFKLFEPEAEILKHLNHPHIPRYQDYFSIDKEAGGGLPWFGLVQEYIPSLSLQQLLQKKKHFTETETKDIANQLLDILIYLHELSPPVLHRDIKPSNIVEEKLYILSMNNAQQAYYEKKGKFVTKDSPQGWTELAVGIKPEMTNYKYSFYGTKRSVYSYAITRNEKIKSYVGAVFIVGNPSNETTKAIVCETQSSGFISFLPRPFLENGNPTCDSGTVKTIYYKPPDR